MRSRDRDVGPLVPAVIVVLLAATAAPFAFPVFAPTEPSVPGGPDDRGDVGGPDDPGAIGGPDDPGDTGDTATPDRRDSREGGDLLTPPSLRPTPASGEGFANCVDRPSSATNATLAGELPDVSVAVVDPSGFDVTDDRIAPDVVATESFRRDRGLDNRGRSGHGTAAAALVTRLAPSADLSLANFDTAYDFKRAVEWAIDRDVDVLVAPVSFYAKPNDGSSVVSEAVTDATEAGIPVVVPTGNVARNHVEATYRGDRRQSVTVGRNDTRLQLRGSHSRVQAWLWWNRSDDRERHDFDVVLYREDEEGARQVAVSRDYPRGPVGTNQVLFEQVRTNNLLSTSAANGSYYLRVRGPENATHRVEVVTVYHRLADATPRGSVVAPATAAGPGVLAVGAADPATGRPLPTSSRGPTADGRRGIDLLAPGTVSNVSGLAFTGTSAASAYVGGVVARLKALEPSLTPAEVEGLLTRTADPVEGVAPNASGAGLLDSRAAVSCVLAEADESGGS